MRFGQPPYFSGLVQVLLPDIVRIPKKLNALINLSNVSVPVDTRPVTSETFFTANLSAWY